MTQPIPKELKDRVIREHLKGKSRNLISKDLGLGAGTVTNIIQKWRSEAAEFEPKRIGEFALELLEKGMTMDDCVKRARITNKMKDLHIAEDKFLELMEEIQVKSIERGTPPEMFGELLSQLFNISRVEKIPLEEIPTRIRQRINEVERIETELKSNCVTSENISSYVSLKDSLAAAGLLNADNDFSLVVKLVKNLKDAQFDANRIIGICSSTIPLENREEFLRTQLNNLQNSVSDLSYLIPFLQEVRVLTAGSFTPSVLRMLIEAVKFRALTDRVLHLVAAQRIMMEIEQLHQIIGFEREILNKKLQIQSLEMKKEELQESWTKDLQAVKTLVDLGEKRILDKRSASCKNSC
jgi:hypothetical protein